MDVLKIASSERGLKTRSDKVPMDAAGAYNGQTVPAKHLGWLPDLPDVRDYTPVQDVIEPEKVAMGVDETVKHMLSRLGIDGPRTALPPRTDLRQWFSPVEDQGSIGSCTANAGVALLEYYERRAFGKHIDASRMFLYKATRNLLHWQGDTGAYLRSTMKAMALFGVPPEEYCPYVLQDFDKEPNAFCYAFAANYQSISYYRLDLPSLSRTMLLDQIKTNLNKGQPSMFGFTVYDSIGQSGRGGEIPFPQKTESVKGGHAVVAVGYDDDYEIRHPDNPQLSTRGALMIRNSWGTGWGMQGYGWLPYNYVLAGIAIDWWCLIASKWLDTGAFENT
ncbi:C1 family peptidase [Pontibacter sp. E15-1]|uniref:C1 family peptidase n=1 Tax=Pontibacter sp. E15-1 TaxID=2919918 RepID=UPI001F4FE40E|nr:C1 family peptidase [Pontibacter sp. E15-1]MCJ8165027.1 C1 family peptidase [Pontibacter sp. E15-1]